MIRNKEMSIEADYLFAIWDGKSPGTDDMIKTMKKMKKWSIIVNLSKNSFKKLVDI